MAFAPWENFEALVQSLLKPATPAATNPLDVASVAEAPKPGAVPKAPSPLSGFLQRPGFGAMAKTAARGLGWAGTAPAAASAGLMAAAGGNPLEAADPFMFARAVGEGAADIMLPESARKAAAQVGGVGGYIRGTGPFGLGEGARPPGPVAPPPVIPPPNAAELALQARENARDASVTAPYASPDAQAYIAAQQDQSRQADKILEALGTRVGRGIPATTVASRPGMPLGERVPSNPDSDMGQINTRIRNIMADPKAIGQFNEAQRLNRTGIMLSRDANGRAVFSNDPGAQPRTYQGADGQPTTDWAKTENYQSAIARAATERAQLTDIEAKREQADALGAVQKYKTVAGRKIAAELYLGGLQAGTARQNVAAHMAATAQKAENDRAKLGIELMTAIANNDEKAASATIKKIQAAAAGMEAASPGATPGSIAATAAGRTPSMHQAFDPNQIVTKPDDPRNVLINGVLKQLTPQRVVTQADWDAVRKKYPSKSVAEVTAGFVSQNGDLSGVARR